MKKPRSANAEKPDKKAKRNAKNPQQRCGKAGTPRRKAKSAKSKEPGRPTTRKRSRTKTGTTKAPPRTRPARRAKTVKNAVQATVADPRMPNVVASRLTSEPSEVCPPEDRKTALIIELEEELYRLNKIGKIAAESALSVAFGLAQLQAMTGQGEDWVTEVRGLGLNLDVACFLLRLGERFGYLLRKPWQTPALSLPYLVDAAAAAIKRAQACPRDRVAEPLPARIKMARRPQAYQGLHGNGHPTGRIRLGAGLPRNPRVATSASPTSPC